MIEGMVQDIDDIDAIIEQFLDFARDEAGEAVDAAADLNAARRLRLWTIASADAVLRLSATLELNSICDL